MGDDDTHFGGAQIQRRDVLRTGATVAGGVGVLGASGVGQSVGGSAAGAGETYRFLWQNLWLLNGIVGNDTDIAKPALQERASEFGDRLAGSDIDVAALCEVFSSEQRETIREPVERAVDYEIGPPAEFEKSSGLYTLALGGPEIVAMERTEFDADGYEPRDADAWAKKGVLYTRLDFGAGQVDLFTTHLLAGGGIPYVDLNPFSDPPTPAEYRADQLAELRAFVQSVEADHDPDNRVPTVVAGDFNVGAGGGEYGKLTAVRDDLGLADAWLGYAGGPGGTNRTAITDGCAFEPAESPPSYCDGGAGGDRIDYVFVEPTRPSHASRLSIEAIKRRVFCRQLAPPDQFYADDAEERPNYLTDHVGLELDWTLTPR
ncbi:endonuclease/exonuclease/phosphatase family protein [Halorientalis pallida]|uniref:Endonuclease/exonuclease/phosphatase n=1 Tax=Halorientalis pallida TaxID=2479928 RepID=A0A498KSE9_9EURY|nr:endonuclease/exonuclease/phosphatase family protein [Halorientalis pallida]RXK47487.1 endonuclease/exonuclease/phosphatase [Halorientalis pallida]